MTCQVRTAIDRLHIVELVPMFATLGLHHIPIVDAQRRLIGIVTNSDLVAGVVSRACGRVGKFSWQLNICCRRNGVNAKISLRACREIMAVQH